MLEIAALPEQTWDAIVVGAGPAGSVAAALLAERGWTVLLVEKSQWPRDKPCGGCVNAHALATLRRLKLDGVLRGSAITEAARFTSAGDSLSVSSPGRAIARDELDRRLVELAIERGVSFISRANASLLGMEINGAARCVLLSDGRTTRTLKTRLVLAADGINGTLLRNESWAKWRVDGQAWMGAACTLPADALDVKRGVIHMHISAGGYVGLVRQADGRIHVGAALDPQRCKSLGGPAKQIETMLREGDVCESFDATVQGIGLLTRHRPIVGDHRVLCVGDACGYVEPFTGEGIAWALASAEAVVSLLPQDLHVWPSDLPRRWKSLHRKTVGRRQRICRAVRFAVRRPWLWRIVCGIAKRAPMAIEWIAPSQKFVLAGERHD